MGSPNRGLIAHRTYFALIRQRTLGSGFFDDICKEFYLRRLQQCQKAFNVQLHAYLLLDTRMLFLFTPQTPAGFHAFIEFLSESYNNYCSIRFERRVQAWQGSTPVLELATHNLIRDCQKFIERLVLRCGECSHPGEYRYSSYCANAFSSKPKYLVRHGAVTEMMRCEEYALEGYRAFIAAPFREEYERFLQSRLLHGSPLLKRRTAYRLEINRTLTDIDKSCTITHTG